MKKIIFVWLVVGMAAATPALAQGSFSVQYSVGLGMGDVKTFISPPSFRGVTLEYKYRLQPKMAVGVDVGWNVFYERKDHDTYTSGSASLTGVQYRYINAVPIFVAFNYYLKPDEKVNPFIGLGVGTLFTSRNTDMNLYTVQTDTWAFAFRPEAGLLIEASPEMDVIVAAKYNAGLGTDDLPAQSYLSINLGFVFKKH